MIENVEFISTLATIIIAAVAVSGLVLRSIDRVDRRIDSLDRRIDSLDTRVSGLEKAMERRVSTLEGYLLRHVYGDNPPPPG